MSEENRTEYIKGLIVKVRCLLGQHGYVFPPQALGEELSEFTEQDTTSPKGFRSAPLLHDLQKALEEEQYRPWSITSILCWLRDNPSEQDGWIYDHDLPEGLVGFLESRGFYRQKNGTRWGYRKGKLVDAIRTRDTPPAPVKEALGPYQGLDILHISRAVSVQEKERLEAIRQMAKALSEDQPYSALVTVTRLIDDLLDSKGEGKEAVVLVRHFGKEQT